MTKTSKRLAWLYRPLGWIPVIVINAIAAWSYFAYVVILCFDSVHNTSERVIYLLLYHPLFLVFVISYWKAILGMPGFTPKKFYLTKEDKDKYENAESPQDVINEIGRSLPIVTASVSKGIRFCEICDAIKPDRSHHCSVCGKCVLKMDHHCPWVNNCVGWGNYKYFILFLFYSILLTMYCSGTSLQYFLKFWSGHNMKVTSSLHVLFLFFVSTMFSISLWSLFGFHLYLLVHNRTTLESFRAPLFGHGSDKNGFNIGKWNNIEQVFGHEKWKWMLPVFTTVGNGYSFPISVVPECEGLLIGNDRSTRGVQEVRSLSTAEQPTCVAYVNGNDGLLKMNGHTEHVGDDDEDDVMFDASKHLKGKHVVLDVRDSVPTSTYDAGDSDSDVGDDAPLVG